jgi:hypothetical protein
MDVKRFVGQIMIFGVPGVGEMMGEVRKPGVGGIIELDHPCVLQLTQQNQLQLRDLVKGNKMLAGEAYFLSAAMVTYAYAPSKELIASYKGLRSGILMPVAGAA